MFDAAGRPIPQMMDAGESDKMVSITRSFSFQLNLGNYESAHFFCSERAECLPADAEEVSRGLYEFCIDQVMDSVRDLKARRAKKAEKAQRSAA